MVLYDEHIHIISGKLEQEGIKDPYLLVDLLDHICCYLEEQEGDDFERLLQEAFQLLAPNGIHEIEEERFFLFHFQNQLTMKKILFFSGFATTFLLTTGLTFKQMHWPGAVFLLLAGNISLLVTILVIAVNGYKQRRAHSSAFNLRVVTGVIAAFLIGMGGIFKILHFPSANIQFLLGILLLNFIFLPLFFLQLYRQSISKTA